MTRSISARCCENITSSVCKKMGENIERITAQDVPSYLTIDLILKMVQSAEQTTPENPQNLRRAKAMVACGSVFDVRKVNGMGFAVEGYVAAEKTSNKFYRTTVDVVDRRHVETCTCIARSNTHRCCKHQVCLLLVLLLIRDRVPPKWCRCVGINRFTDPNNPTFKAARLGLTFNELLGQLQTPATHYSGKKANLVNEV